MALFPVETINEWIEDFRALGNRVPSSLRTLERDLDEGRFDGGLVLIRFETATTETFLERPSHLHPQWSAHFEEREQELVLSAAEVQSLADELQLLSQLVAYLETRTAEALARLDRDATETAATSA
jgi:hypothetical protein